MSAMSERAAVIDQLIADLPAQDLKALAERLASQVGYVLVAETADPDRPLAACPAAENPGPPAARVLWRSDLERQIARVTAERDAALKDAESWKASVDQYANAWLRELGPYGLRNKRHEIDALVLTTRDLVAGYKAWVHETQLFRERRRQEAIAATLGWTGVLPIDGAQTMGGEAVDRG